MATKNPFANGAFWFTAHKNTHGRYKCSYLAEKYWAY
jgi:hypothetical protein